MENQSNRIAMKETNNQLQTAPAALHLLSAAHFLPLVGQDFIVRFSKDTAVIGQLEEVLELPGHSALERKPFSILLQTNLKTTYYLQAIYSVEHPVLGVLLLFLVPLGIKGKGMQYEAVFS
jgi:hypothetical protein